MFSQEKRRLSGRRAVLKYLKGLSVAAATAWKRSRPSCGSGPREEGRRCFCLRGRLRGGCGPGHGWCTLPCCEGPSQAAPPSLRGLSGHLCGWERKESFKQALHPGPAVPSSPAVFWGSHTPTLGQQGGDWAARIHLLQNGADPTHSLPRWGQKHQGSPPAQGPWKGHPKSGWVGVAAAAQAGWGEAGVRGVKAKVPGALPLWGGQRSAPFQLSSPLSPSHHMGTPPSCLGSPASSLQPCPSPPMLHCGGSKTRGQDTGCRASRWALVALQWACCVWAAWGVGVRHMPAPLASQGKVLRAARGLGEGGEGIFSSWDLGSGSPSASRDLALLYPSTTTSLNHSFFPALVRSPPYRDSSSVPSPLP